MATLYLPSEEDVEVLREMLSEWKGRTRGSTRRPAVPGEEGESPEVFVARVPEGGIAGLDENTTGTETASETVGSYLQDDVVSYADCTIYRKVVTNGVSTLTPLGRTKRVYNLARGSVVGRQWVLVTKDKFGDWYVTSPIDASSSSSVAGSGSSGDTIEFVRISSSTAVTGNLYPGVLQTYTVAGGYADTGTAVRVQFPNNEVPGLAIVSAVSSGETSGGETVYLALERPLTVAATDAGTGDANATYYGISTLNVNQGTGLALTNSSLSCKVAAQSASATHSGVINLTAGQVLGSGGKLFRSYVYVNSSQQVPIGSVAFDVGGNNGLSILNCYVNTSGATHEGLVRINTSSPTSGGELVVNGVIQAIPISVSQAWIRAQGQITADQQYRVGGGGTIPPGTPGFTGQYTDGVNTRLVIQGGIITGVF